MFQFTLFIAILMETLDFSTPSKVGIMIKTDLIKFFCSWRDSIVRVPRTPCPELQMFNFNAFFCHINIYTIEDFVYQYKVYKISVSN